MKQIFIIAIILVLCTSLASAGFFPQIISGQVSIEGKTYDSIDVKITNTRTNEVMTVQTDSRGFYTAELGEIYYKNDCFSVQVCEGDSKCRKNICTRDSIPSQVNFGLEDLPTTCPQTICPECKCEGTVCEPIIDCTQCTTDSPVSFWYKGGTVSAGLLALLAAIAGYGYVNERKKRIDGVKSWVREILQNAPNIVIGKLNDIMADGEMWADFKAYALEYEKANKARQAVIQFLVTAMPSKEPETGE